MKSYKYKLINILLVIFLGVTLFIWWHLRSELNKVKAVMIDVKNIELKDKEVNSESDLSNIIDFFMKRTDLKVIDIALYQQGGEIFIQCDNSLNLIAFILRDIESKVKDVYIKELKLNTEECEFTLVFVK